MEVAADALSAKDAYHLVTCAVVPRPVAWASTTDAAGRPNLAPFSFFNAVTSDPPILVVGIGRTRGERKDTAANLLETGECVVHIASRSQARALVATAAPVPRGTDEFELAGLAKLPSVDVRPPRVAGAPIAMECRVHAHHAMGRAPSDVFFLRVLRFHVDDAVLRDGRPDARLLDAVGRLGGDGYCGTADVYEIPR